MATQKELEEQIIDLQSRLSHQEDTLFSLNNIVIQQDQRISQLQKKLLQYQQRIEDVLISTETKVKERPPHY